MRLRARCQPLEAIGGSTAGSAGGRGGGGGADALAVDAAGPPGAERVEHAADVPHVLVALLAHVVVPRRLVPIRPRPLRLRHLPELAVAPAVDLVVQLPPAVAEPAVLPGPVGVAVAGRLAAGLLPPQHLVGGLLVLEGLRAGGVGGAVLLEAVAAGRRGRAVWGAERRRQQEQHRGRQRAHQRRLAAGGSYCQHPEPQTTVTCQSSDTRRLILQARRHCYTVQKRYNLL